MMYVLDYLIYHLKPFGLLRNSQRLPAKLKVGEFLPPPREETLASNEDSKDDEDDFLTKSTTTASINVSESLTSDEVNSIQIRRERQSRLLKDIKQLDNDTKELELLYKNKKKHKAH